MADIRNFDYPNDPAAEVEGIRHVTSEEISTAVEALITAAAGARTREFAEDTVASTDEAGNTLYNLWHIPSGEYWTPVDGGYLNTTTQERVDYDLRQPNEAQYAWVRDEFEYFHERPLATPLFMAKTVEDARSAILSGAMTPIVEVQNTVDDWYGLSQQQFKEGFLDPFMMNLVHNQQALLTELAVALYAYEGLLRQARIEAKKVAEKTTDALDGLSQGSGVTIAMVVELANVTKSLADALTSGDVAGLGLTLLDTGLRSRDGDSTRQIGGTTAEETLDSMKAALTGLQESMDREEEDIADRIRDTTSNVSGMIHSGNSARITTYLPHEAQTNGDPSRLTDGEVPTEDEFGPPN